LPSRPRPDQFFNRLPTHYETGAPPPCRSRPLTPSHSYKSPFSSFFFSLLLVTATTPCGISCVCANPHIAFLKFTLLWTRFSVSFFCPVVFICLRFTSDLSDGSTFQQCGCVSQWTYFLPPKSTALLDCVSLVFPASSSPVLSLFFVTRSESGQMIPHLPRFCGTPLSQSFFFFFGGFPKVFFVSLLEERDSRQTLGSSGSLPPAAHPSQFSPRPPTCLVFA